ncbi:MAG TPA: cation diffusion facilitator family transporter [Acidimicrobiales bacterium]|nr:cation diffusion facilitator family transporter [Acidimicrobiales bacterium]
MSGSHGHSHGHSHVGPDRSAVFSGEGIRAIKISTFGLLLTALIQFVVVWIGGSVGLLADSLHNFADVFTTVALWIAFNASRRAADRRYTYGYDRFEDLVGVVIVGIIGLSCVISGFEAYRALVRPHRVTEIGVSIAAGVVGIVGNELVARFKIRVGRKIRSAALVADGIHSRTDGWVSAGAVSGLIGVSLGYPKADPVAALVITAAIAWVTVTAAREVVARLVDRVEEGLIDSIEQQARSVQGVADVHDVRARWAGRSLYVQMDLAVPEDLPLRDAHAIAEEVRHAVLHGTDGVSEVTVHVDPWSEANHRSAYHVLTAHHDPATRAHGHHVDDHDHAHDSRHDHSTPHGRDH